MLGRRTRRRSRTALALGLLAVLIPVSGLAVLLSWLERTPRAELGSASGRSGFFRGLPRVATIAHRGASKRAPEHSLEAYALALDRGAEILELDLRALSDGSLVVAHDADLERLAGRPERLAELSPARLRELCGARTPEPLSRVLEAFPGARFNLELKDESVEVARELSRLLDVYGAGGRVLVASAHHEVLLAFRNATDGEIPTSASAREALAYYACDLLGRRCPPPQFAALQVPAIGWLGLDSPRFVSQARERGLAVHFFTIDDAARMRELIAAGADGIMTNRPGRLRDVIGELSETPGFLESDLGRR